jgi:cysteine desulfurase/selenocysteine lyase
MNSLGEHLEKEPKIVAVTHISNVLGTINDVKEITKKAHKHGAKVLVDGAQSAPHMPIDVKSIGCDFFAFSSHKMLGPTGIGVLYAKKGLLEEMNPVIGGGDMISTVQYYSCTWNELPWKFEAGTSNIADAIGFGAAIDYLSKIGMADVHNYEQHITKYALQELSQIKNVKIFGLNSKEINRRSGVISFAIGKVHAHDIAQVFDSEGIAIRAGHHCAMPLVTNELGQSAVARMSFYIYNTKEELETVVRAIQKVKKIFMVD